MGAERSGSRRKSPSFWFLVHRCGYVYRGRVEFSLLVHGRLGKWMGSRLAQDSAGFYDWCSMFPRRDAVQLPIWKNLKEARSHKRNESGVAGVRDEIHGIQSRVESLGDCHRGASSRSDFGTLLADHGIVR